MDERKYAILFAATILVDLLARGATPYDVAKMLGDTVDTIEKHYAPFVSELRERVRRVVENGQGIEQILRSSLRQKGGSNESP